jgi:cardiolipin-specific phospholipase
MFAWRQGSSPYLALQAQEKLLQHFLKRCTYEVRSVPTNGMNYVVIQNKQKAILNNHPGRVQGSKKTLVMMHGYGAGLGFFYDNFDGLADYYDQVIAVDWLGMGCSDRNTRKVPRLNRLHSIIPSNQDCSLQVTRKVIDEFVDGLEELCDHERLGEITLAGHSLGGYLSGQYSLKYPTRLNGLILISPVGVPDAPSRGEQLSACELDWKIRILKELWQWNVTPQGLVRFAGKRGENMILNAIDQRFDRRWSGEDAKAIGQYTYQITKLPGNGEYCLNALLEPIFTKPINGANGREGRMGRTGVYAKYPLDQEFRQMPHRPWSILLVFGQHDWLYYPEAASSVQAWQRAYQDQRPTSERAHDKSRAGAELLMVPDAGHHLYLENASFFNQKVVDWVRNEVFR